MCLTVFEHATLYVCCIHVRYYDTMHDMLHGVGIVILEEVYCTDTVVRVAQYDYRPKVAWVAQVDCEPTIGSVSIT